MNNIKHPQPIGYATTVIKSAMMKMDGEVVKVQGIEQDK